MPQDRRRASPSMSTLEVACVVVVLLALAVLVAWVVLHWSEGRTNVLG